MKRAVIGLVFFLSGCMRIPQEKPVIACPEDVGILRQAVRNARGDVFRTSPRAGAEVLYIALLHCEYQMDPAFPAKQEEDTHWMLIPSKLVFSEAREGAQTRCPTSLEEIQGRLYEVNQGGDLALLLICRDLMTPDR